MAKSNENNMKRKGFFCSDKLWNALEAVADSTGTPVAEHLRAAIAQYVKNYEQSNAPRT